MMLSGTSQVEEVEKVRLRSSDGELFEVSAVVMSESVTIKNMMEEDCAADEIPLPNVTAPILAKVIEYCNRHADAKVNNLCGSKESLELFDEDFVRLDQNTLLDLALAANYLNIQGLLDLSCKGVADLMRGKSVEEIRNKFHIATDYTKEKEEEVRKENSWAFV